jgi:Neutral/alkaline non-lysosomal ceramidase, N-terminal
MLDGVLEAVTAMLKTLALAFLLTFALGGCSYTIRIPGYKVSSYPSTQHFIAGAGKAEITPPTGFPMGGHGPGGRIARGYWTRLYARAFYFQDRNNRVMVLVSCDLFAMPAGLRANVLELVNRKESLRPDDLIISATHTHHGPGNFASSELYNGFASPLPHFDQDLFNFLATKISDAIVEAIRDAHSHVNEPFEVRLHEGYATGIQRNRAIAPFFKNDANVQKDIFDDSKRDGSACPDGSQINCPRYLAVDPSLKVLEVLRNGSQSGLLIFYAVHPTAMTHDSELYSSDLAGVAMQLLERGGAPVAGFFNGAEGDVSPDWTEQDRDDVLRLAKNLATATTRLLNTPYSATDSDPLVEVRWNRVPRNWTAGPAGPAFAKKPLAGAAEIGGAEDGRTIFYNYGWRGEARKANPSGDQGIKEPGLDQPLADALRSIDCNFGAEVVKVIKPTHVLAPAKVFPQEVPVVRAQLGNVFSLAAVPVEATTAVGRMIREDLKVTAVVGLANEYFGYTATEAEYALQQYEGASTLLGPGEAKSLDCLLRNAQSYDATVYVPAVAFRAGPLRSNKFGPGLLAIRIPRNTIDEDLEPLIPRRLRRLESRIPRFEWTEDESGDWQTESRRASIFAKPKAQMAYEQIDADSGFNFLTVIVDARTSKRRYAVLWLPPEIPPVGTTYFFRVQSADGQTLCSETFQLEGLQPSVPVPLIPALPGGACPAT